MIKTKYGNIEGVIENNCKLYKGIPFAKPPVGDLRFKAPQEVEAWEGIYLADKFPNAPMQTPAPSDDFYGKEFNSDTNPQYSEDCLYLNIWTPMEAKEGDNLPVAVWFYGGGLVSGYSAEKEFDGTEYAKRGVILITANYRVGLFGFMCHPWLAEENNGRCGNYGCLDELAALQWVKENIVHFGGDSSNITLFGQSSGALTSQTLVISPLTKNLVSKCIMQSGAGYENGFGKNGLQEDFYDLGEKAVELLDVHSVEELRNVSAEKILEVSDQLIGWYLEQGKGMGYEPVIDGYFLIGDSEENQRNGNYLDIPYILGSTANDICTPEGETVPKEENQLHQGCVKWCEHQIELGKIPSYVYYFKRRLPGDDAGAFHSADLWYTFGTLKRCWRPFTELDYKLSSEMMDYWTNFMKYGDPNGLGLCKWNPWDNYNNEIKIFDITDMQEKELTSCDICKMLVSHLKILFMELEKATRENDSNAKCASLLEMKCYYWLTKEYSDKLLNECNCDYRIEFGRILENLKDIFGKDGIVLDENRRKCDICKILPCEFFSLLDRTCSLKNEEHINFMVKELRYHLTLAFIYEEFIGKCIDCEEYIDYIACLQFLYDFLENNNQQKLQQDVYYWKIATNNDAIWSSADALVRNEKLPSTDVDLENQIKIYLDFNIYQRYEKEDRVHDFFETLIQREDVAIVYSGTHLEEIMRMGGEEYKAKRIEGIQKLTGGKIVMVGTDKKTVICIQDIHKRFGIVKKYWKMNVAAEERVCIQAEAREHLRLHEFEENQEKAIGSSSLRGILTNIDKSGKKIIEELPDEKYLNKVLRYVGIGDRDIREYADALSDEKKEFSEVRASIVSIAGLLNILGLHGDKITRKTNPGAVYPIYHRDSFQTIRSSYYDNDHLAFATECTYFVTTDKNLYNKAKEIYCFLGVNTEPILLNDFMELEIWKNNTKKF